MKATTPIPAAIVCPLSAVLGRTREPAPPALVTRETMLPLYVANGVTGVRDMMADWFESCDGARSTIRDVRGWSLDIERRP